MPCFQCPWEPHCHALIHLTSGAAILSHGRISKIRARHEMRTDAGYNYMYESGQWVPIGDVRPASVRPKGGSHHPAPPFTGDLFRRFTPWVVGSGVGVARNPDRPPAR